MTETERERQYSPSSMLDGPLEPFLSAYVQRSQEAYEAVGPVHEIRYGLGPANTIDLARPDNDEPVPVHMFIHGGYWQQLSKRESFFLALDVLRQGSAFAAVDYTLAPEASVDEIVAECCSAIAALHGAADDHGLDSTAITVSGSSAGAHLAAMSALRLPAQQRPAGLILVSGVYELEPLVDTSINDLVGLDVEAARRNSPMLLELEGFPPSVVAFGQHETAEFKAQSQALVDGLRAAGCPVVETEIAARNHFDVVFDIASLLQPMLPEPIESPGAP